MKGKHEVGSGFLVYLCILYMILKNWIGYIYCTDKYVEFDWVTEMQLVNWICYIYCTGKYAEFDWVTEMKSDTDNYIGTKHCLLANWDYGHHTKDWKRGSLRSLIEFLTFQNS